jgi:hypothetical protein
MDKFVFHHWINKSHHISFENKLVYDARFISLVHHRIGLNFYIVRSYFVFGFMLLECRDLRLQSCLGEVIDCLICFLLLYLVDMNIKNDFNPIILIAADHFHMAFCRYMNLLRIKMVTDPLPDFVGTSRSVNIICFLHIG